MQGALSALGIAKKAGKLICGTPLVCKALGGRCAPAIVVMSTHASDNTKKRLRDKCTYYGVRLYELEVGTEELSAAVGGDAHLAACAVCDRELARLFLSKTENI